MIWSTNDLGAFLDLFSTFWPGYLADPKTRNPTRVAEHWIQTFGHTPIVYVLAAIRSIYDEQEIQRAPTVKRVREAVAEARLADKAGEARTAGARQRRLVAQLEAAVRPEYARRLEYQNDPEVRWETFRDDVLAGRREVRDREGFEWLRKILDRNQRKRGLASIREPGEEAE